MIRTARRAVATLPCGTATSSSSAVARKNNQADALAVRRRHAPRTRPLSAKATNGRPMLMKTSGHGFVSNAENAEIVEYSTNRNANQQTIAIFNPAESTDQQGQCVIDEDRRDDRDHVRYGAVRPLDVGHRLGVIVQPHLAKYGVPTPADQLMQNDENPDREVIDLVVQRFSRLSGGCNFDCKRIVVAALCERRIILFGGHRPPLQLRRYTAAVSTSVSDRSGTAVSTGAGSIEIISNFEVPCSVLSVTTSPGLWPSNA